MERRRWLAEEVVASDSGAPDRIVTRGVRTLQWHEIARLIEIKPDGSWHPTDFARAWMRRPKEEALEG